MTSPLENARIAALFPPITSSEPSFETLCSIVEEQPESHRYDMQLTIMQFLNGPNKGTKTVSMWYTYALESEMWKQSCSKAEFDKEWSQARRHHKAYLKTLAYIDRIHQRAIETWGKQNARALFTRITTTRNTAEKVNKLIAKGITFQELQLGLNRQVVDRLKRGLRRWCQPCIMAKDLSRAEESSNPTPVQPDELRDLNLVYDTGGFVTAHPSRI